eukprot:scaffold571_cov364-Prasinococcus_capsulatus_cf.AAC.15
MAALASTPAHTACTASLETAFSKNVSIRGSCARSFAPRTTGTASGARQRHPTRPHSCHFLLAVREYQKLAGSGAERLLVFMTVVCRASGLRGEALLAMSRACYWWNVVLPRELKQPVCAIAVAQSPFPRQEHQGQHSRALAASDLLGCRRGRAHAEAATLWRARGRRPGGTRGANQACHKGAHALSCQPLAETGAHANLCMLMILPAKAPSIVDSDDSLRGGAYLVSDATGCEGW